MFQVKNRAPAPIQITAEQILLESQTRTAGSGGGGEELRREARDQKGGVAEQTGERRLFKKACSTVGATPNEIPCT